MEIWRHWRSEYLGEHSDPNDPNNYLSEKSYQELLNGSCLPEKILDKYMELITKLYPSKLYAFNTHFFTALSDHGYLRIHRWTKNVDIFSKERLFIPIYLKSNRTWSLINVNFQDQTIRFYDSVGSGYNGGIRHIKLILKYLKVEYFMRKRKLYTTNWKYVVVKRIHPEFKYWDSGLFMCFAAYHFALNKSEDARLYFPSKSIGGQRNVKKKLLLQIKRNSII